MDTVLFGFYSEMSRHDMRDVYLFMLGFAVLLLIGGRYLENQCLSKDFLHLIRFRRLSDWWRRLAARTVAVSLLESTGLFLIALFLVTEGGVEIAETRTVRILGLVYGLWGVGMVTVNLFQLILINLRDGYKLSFLLMITVMALSLYNKAWPGSFIMLRRSNILTGEGYSCGAVLLVQIAFDGAIGLFGYRILERRR